MPAVKPEQLDPERDVRRLVLYFGGLIVFYVAALILFWPGRGPGVVAPDSLFLMIMFAPTVGALLARFAGPGIIWWGWPGWWLVAGLIPAVAGLGVYLLAAAADLITENPTVLKAALAGSVFAIMTAAMSAVGEEIGWRGFLWPQLRARRSFLVTSAIVGAIWWAYHVPVILLGWYGSLSGLPAFTVAIAGATLFVGVITDRSGSLWPSVVTHGAWNGLVATSFVASVNGTEVPAFTGSDTLMGEFGWLAAGSILTVALVATWWHLRSGRYVGPQPLAEVRDEARPDGVAPEGDGAGPDGK